MDTRIQKLADLLVTYSLAVKPGEKVLIEAFEECTHPLVETLMHAVAQAGGVPFYLLHNSFIDRAQQMHCTAEQMALEAAWQKTRMEVMDCYIAVRGFANALELSDVPTERKLIFSNTVSKEVHFGTRIPKTRWVVLRYPNPAFAQSARLSTRAFEDFFFEACTLDYSRMSQAMDPLVELMQKTDRVHITGPGTDVRFSIKGIPVIKCDGHINIPDGEVFTAPVRDSIEGVSFCNTPTLYEGVYFHNIRLTWKQGRIVDFNCETGDKSSLASILDRDEGARYAGEFALGFNPFVKSEMLDVLFDEKIAGSFHLTPGNAYDMAFNGNKSQIHWDMVYRQDPASGGGEIYFDGKLVRKDGVFVLPELQGLNPEALR